MALADRQIADQNPWWADLGWEDRDPHLRRLANQPRRLPAEVVKRVDLGAAAIHTLRGPRQVGKSTDLKLLAQRAIGAGLPARRVLYLTLELLEGQSLSEVTQTIRRAKDLARGEGSSLILLDEVTFVEGWQTAIKSLWDDGTIDEDVVLCTGSSAVDLRSGTADRLPGRRGAGRDFGVFPQSFASFARALYPSIPDSPELSIGAALADPGWELLEDARVHLPRLDEALALYQRFGGLPAAVVEAIDGAAEPSEEVKSIAYDSLLRELQRRRLSRPGSHALLERVLRSLGSKTSWARMSKEMGVDLQPAPSRASVRDYVELLAASYSLLIVYFWRSDSNSPELSKDKKLYFADPLLHSVALDLAPGLSPDSPALIENLIGLALHRRYEPSTSRLEGFDAPSALHVWQTRRSGEIDFVCGVRGKPELIEVKYQRNPDLRRAAAIPRAFPGRPVVVATADRLERRGPYSLVPASLLLWLLG